jgi:hypothetical protein
MIRPAAFVYTLARSRKKYCPHAVAKMASPSADNAEEFFFERQVKLFHLWLVSLYHINTVLRISHTFLQSLDRFQEAAVPSLKSSIAGSTPERKHQHSLS